MRSTKMSSGWVHALLFAGFAAGACQTESIDLGDGQGGAQNQAGSGQGGAGQGGTNNGGTGTGGTGAAGTPLCGSQQLQCGDQQFCEFSEGTCGGDRFNAVNGACQRMPEVCTLEFSPVCGCDGVTYGNDCARRGAGVSRRHGGECQSDVVTVSEGQSCGGMPMGASRVCAQGLFCEQKPGSCTLDDAPGICRVMPQGCEKNLAPVCSCDNVTFANDCTRRAKGAQLAHIGECQPNQSLLLTGLWGGKHIQLNVKDPRVGGEITFDCGSATIAGPLTLTNGGFTWKGTFTPGGGPDPMGGRPPVAATFTGATDGTTLKLNMRTANSSADFVMTLGVRGDLVFCL